MKGQILSLAMVLCFGAIAGVAARQDTDYFEKYSAGSKTIEHPILAKVFPGIEFKQEFMDTRPPQSRIVALWEGQKMIMPYDFNKLYTKVADISRAGIEEKIEAFIRLAFWRPDSDLTIVKQDTVSKQKREFYFRQRAIINLKGKGHKPEQLELFFRLSPKGEILEMDKYQNGEWELLYTPLPGGCTDKLH